MKNKNFKNPLQNRNRLSRKYHNKNYDELDFMGRCIIDSMLGLPGIYVIV